MRRITCVGYMWFASTRAWARLGDVRQRGDENERHERVDPTDHWSVARSTA